MTGCYSPWGCQPISDGDPNPSRDDGGPESGAVHAGRSTLMLALGKAQAANLALVAAHDGTTPETFAQRAVNAAVMQRAEAIGLPGLVDIQCVGGAEAARRSQAHHKPEVAGSQDRATGLDPSFGPHATSSDDGDIAGVPEFDRANTGRPEPPG